MNITALLYVDDGLTDDDLTFAGSFLPEQLKEKLLISTLISDVRYSVHEKYSGKIENPVIRNDKDDVNFWKNLFTDLNTDHIIKIFCDSPFMDIKIISEMIDVHTKYLAEFTYSENLPSGFSCEIFSKELIGAIPETSEKTLPLSQIIRSNINKFDVELYYHEPDIRDKRLSFRCGSGREKQVMERILKNTGSVPEYSHIKEIIDRNPEVLYLCPSYIEIEITGRCELDCIFCYRKSLSKIREDMDVNIFRKIMKDMEFYKLPYSICIGGSGEPLMHSSFYEIMDIVANESLIENIIIETNGLLAGSNFKEYIINNNSDKIKTIFNINAFSNENYISIHGSDHFDTVFKNITSLKESLPEKDDVYLQIMKINETEPFLDKYYDFWEKYKIPIILQKQNTFLGRIKDRNYSDLTPLERTPCWHLQRDLNILSDGNVIFCKQDINGDLIRGNIANKSINQIFDNSRDTFLNDYNKKLAVNPDCASCNEWYTFNL